MALNSQLTHPLRGHYPPSEKGNQEKSIEMRRSESSSPAPTSQPRCMHRIILDVVTDRKDTTDCGFYKNGLGGEEQ